MILSSYLNTRKPCLEQYFWNPCTCGILVQASLSIVSTVMYSDPPCPDFDIVTLEPILECFCFCKKRGDISPLPRVIFSTGADGISVIALKVLLQKSNVHLNTLVPWYGEQRSIHH